MSLNTEGNFRGLRIIEIGGSTQVSVEMMTDADLPAGDVKVEVSFSDLNFKDGLIMEPGSRRPAFFPIVPGIDFVGTVSHSQNPRFVVGDRVLANGFGLGTERDGGLTQRTRVPGEWLTVLPPQLEDLQAAAIGTAGYTAALALNAILDAGVKPSNGPVLVTGAGGGVGSIAIILLAGEGFEVVASTGRAEQLASSLKNLGASDVIGRLVVNDGGLAAPIWAGAIDSVGSSTLASVLAATRYGGAVATVGLAQGADLPTTVLPFILRGVSLLGIDSVYASAETRRHAWSRLAGIDQRLLGSVTTVVGLADAPSISKEIVEGRVHGRVVVDVRQ